MACTLQQSTQQPRSWLVDTQQADLDKDRTPIKSLIKSNFLFGESEIIYRRNLVDFLRDGLANKASDSKPQKVVLVGCAILNELRILKDLGIDLRDKGLFAIEGILDLNTITQTLDLPFKTRPSLMRILQQINIPFREECLHDAGNDAHFTLRALLMLAAIVFEQREADGITQQRIDGLKAIALDPIDFSLTTPDELKRLKRDKDAKRAADCRARPQTKRASDCLADEGVDVCLGTILLNMEDET
ncbi:hypothetical protein ONS95_011125 [Cadophora gregata]|uniref:uncharacterized protein n=1 Tax=Cadophora gregata TaxID=51156 RepID=UPI0026DD5260|nr:uncharacterized protein ONS95_011125 [Cadophora gregata]KAK0119689.1 hypothetical protein ONS95_011125 [Cadophora gregata]KAK0120724.1 hypothetical protein ONS96_010927 [Cadophora gregata f. sp. sojae]